MNNNTLHTLECEWCGNTFTHEINRTKTCSSDCRRIRQNHLNKEKYHTDPKTKQQKIAASIKWQKNNPERFAKNRKAYWLRRSIKQS